MHSAGQGCCASQWAVSIRGSRPALTCCVRERATPANSATQPTPASGPTDPARHCHGSVHTVRRSPRAARSSANACRTRCAVTPSRPSDVRVMTLHEGAAAARGGSCFVRLPPLTQVTAAPPAPHSRWPPVPTATQPLSNASSSAALSASRACVSGIAASASMFGSAAGAFSLAAAAFA